MFLQYSILSIRNLLFCVLQQCDQSVPGGPREPWHDLHCRIDGPAAHDIMTNFEQRWRKAAKWRDIRLRHVTHWHENTLLKIERLSFILTPKSGPDGDLDVRVTTEEDPENWHVQVSDHSSHTASVVAYLLLVL